jgi:NADH-quinone oxidoreductase subunit M
MPEMHFFWLELAVLLPALGALWVRAAAGVDTARRRATLVSGITLLATLGAWQDFHTLHTLGAHDLWDPVSRLLHREGLVLDELSAPLLPLAALISFLTILATPRSKGRQFSFVRALLADSILLATFASRQPWPLIVLLAAGTLPPLRELTRTRKPVRVYVVHMGVFVVLLVLGQLLLDGAAPESWAARLGVILLAAATLLRSGVVPVHCWMTDLFEHATFGTALISVTPMVGAYAVIRLVLPVAPGWVLQSIAMLSLFTALYASGMALVQREARRFFCYLFLSHASLVLVGIETGTPIGLTAALSLWISVGLALTGFGLTLRGVELRTGRISLVEFHGLQQHVPMLAALFLLTGLASIGFPGTVGFVGVELLLEAAVQSLPFIGATVVIVAALNGLAVMHAYFRIFTGTPHRASIDLGTRTTERISVLILSALILGGGLYPQPGIHNRYHAALGLARTRVPRAPAADGGHDGGGRRPAALPRPADGPEGRRGA